MEIIEIKTKKQKKAYIDFVFSIYKNDDKYCDLNNMFVKNFLYKKDSYAKRCKVFPLIIKDGEIKAVGIYIFDNNSTDLKLSFVEFLPDAEKYLRALIEYGKQIAIKNNFKEMVIGINGHISYGLGILENNGCDYEFNSNYHPKYYTDELDKLGLIKKKAYSYIYDLNNTANLRNDALLKTVYENYSFRCFNPKNFKKEMLIFGDLCHKTLVNTLYYSEKTNEEMYELMSEMKMVLKKEDIIFALKDGKEIGFVFAHPDYAELFKTKKFNKLSFYLGYKFKKINKLIYNIFGILPEHQSKGLAVALIYETLNVRKNKPYDRAVSSFILKDNIPSTKVSSLFSLGINREFNLYILEMDHV